MKSEAQKRANKKYIKSHPEVARRHRRLWRRRHPEKWNSAKKRNYDLGRPINCHHEQRRWTCHEDDLLFTSSKCDRELAVQLGRSVRAIQVRRAKIKCCYHDDSGLP